MATEASYYGAIGNGLLMDRWTCYKIEDAGFNKKPFDFGGITPDGRGVGLEVKLLRGRVNEDLRWGELLRDDKWFGPDRQHQVSWLRQFAERGGVGLVLVICQGRVGGVETGLCKRVYRLTGCEGELDRPLVVCCVGTLDGQWRGWNRLLEWEKR